MLSADRGGPRPSAPPATSALPLEEGIDVARGLVKCRLRRLLPENSRLQSQTANDAGPQVDLEYLYDVVNALDEVAQETGRSIPQVALNWLLQRPTVSTVVIGARNEEQLKQNLGAVGWNLTPEQVAKLDKASQRPKPYPYWHQAGFAYRNPTPV